ncbi:MAG TPA: hypothetical protein VF751_06435 [Chthoniobacterales bacterium]
MAVAPEHHRTAGPVIPWFPLPAILGLALLGVGGSAFIAYSTFSYAEAERPANPPDKARVYEARAVPFDSPREEHAQRIASISRALTAAQTEVRRAETAKTERSSQVSQPMLLADFDRQLKGFDHFRNFAGANTYLAVAGTSFGISAQSLPSGVAAPDAETVMAAPVPEASTWMCGVALFVLVGARGMRARVHRNRRRSR